MRRVAIVCAFLGLASPLATAGEQSQLLGCFASAMPSSRGPGIDLSLSERSTDPRAPFALALPGEFHGQVGFFVYTGEDAFFVGAPRTREPLSVLTMDLQLPGRGPMRCDLMAQPGVVESVSLHCKLRDDPPGVKRTAVRPKPLGRDDGRWPLKSYLLQRLETVGAIYRQRVAAYADARDAYEKCPHVSGLSGVFRSWIGWKDEPPTRPNPSPYLRDLEPCRNVEDPTVRGEAESARRSIQQLAPELKPAPVCGG
jgi:hypothetical protein